MTNIFGDVAKELVGMFLADARLTISILVLVAAVAGLVDWLRVNPGIAGGLLLVGTLLILVESVVREAKQRNEL